MPLETNSPFSNWGILLSYSCGIFIRQSELLLELVAQCINECVGAERNIGPDCKIFDIYSILVKSRNCRSLTLRGVSCEGCATMPNLVSHCNLNPVF